jgi:hypothetical protein
LGGFLFGFETAVISGAEKTIQALWHLSSGWQGFTVASSLIGTVYRVNYCGHSRPEIWSEKSINRYSHSLPALCDWLCP